MAGSGRSSRSVLAKSLTTPTMRIHSAAVALTNLKRWPIGSCPFQYRRSVSRLIMATLYDCSVSLVEKLRPPINGIRTTFKYPGLTIEIPADGRSESSDVGCPSISNERIDKGSTMGRELARATPSTAGSPSTPCNICLKN